MFKKGDKIKCTNALRSNLSKDKTYIVACDQNSSAYVTILIGNEEVYGWLANRFVLVADPTDQELADDYRHARDKLMKIRNDLIARGYRVFNKTDGTTQISKPTYTHL